VITVVVPAVLGAVYFGFVASDVYISESRFLVRTPQRGDSGSTGGLTALLQTTGFARATDDTYSVHDYVQSRDASNELDTTMHLRQVYGSRDVDFVNRFGALDWDGSLEAFNVYYQNKVDIEYDPSTSITTLTVRAFSAKDAHDINERLIAMSERLLNTMNERSRHDLVDTAEREVRKAEEVDLDVTQRLMTFRTQGNVMDPVGEAGIALARVGRMRDDLVATESQLDQLRRVAPQNPQIGALEAHMNEMRHAMAAEAASVTGKAGSLNAKSGPLGRLQLEKDFADRTLQGALADLEGARAAVTRKHLYLERLVQPNVPDKAMEPRRLRGVITVLAVGFLAWGVLAMLAAIVREHSD
jgi:capsular polysaccharide transport system permease protein